MHPDSILLSSTVSSDRSELQRRGDNAQSLCKRYASWTPRLLKAAYNYQLVTKDPGAYAHNPVYAMQLLYDSLESLSARINVNLIVLRRP
jgi:hypothetical protein